MYHMILWQGWDHGSSSVANYRILNCGFEHFITYCGSIWLSQINLVCVNQILWNPYKVHAGYHQCNIYSNHFTSSPSTTSPSPSMNTAIYHQHHYHYHHYYHHDLCHSFHPAMNHPLLHAMCPLFVSLCDSVQTYSIIVPAEAVWQPDQLQFDDVRACLALQL